MNALADNDFTHAARRSLTPPSCHSDHASWGARPTGDLRHAAVLRPLARRPRVRGSSSCRSDVDGTSPPLGARPHRATRAPVSCRGNIVHSFAGIDWDPDARHRLGRWSSTPGSRRRSSGGTAMPWCTTRPRTDRPVGRSDQRALPAAALCRRHERRRRRGRLPLHGHRAGLHVDEMRPLRMSADDILHEVWGNR